ncbi:MAG: hypothetical protein WBZ42_08750 [Halobacteriota archaeon]
MQTSGAFDGGVTGKKVKDTQNGTIVKNENVSALARELNYLMRIFSREPHEKDTRETISNRISSDVRIVNCRCTKNSTNP